VNPERNDMKLSDKILFGFLGFIFLYLTAAFAELRINGTPNVIDDKNSAAETVAIPGVQYLVVTGVDKPINVTGSDRSVLEVRSFTGDFLAKVKYKVSGDTLTISGILSEATEPVKISVILPKTSLKGIAVDGSFLRINGLQSAHLSISQNSGSIWVTGSTIGKTELNLNRAYLDISGTRLDTVSASVEHSQVNIFSAVGLLSGSMKNGSVLRVNNAQEIQFRKDESSRLNMMQ
jgi:hypothetical protein